MDAQQEDLRAAIEACLAKNGENAATGDIDLNGNALILDADADTKIDVTTDDRIDFNAGGSDIVRFDGTTASVMNFFDLVAKATGTKPVLKARGEANIGLAFEDSNGNEIFQFDTVASAVNYLVAASSATGNALTLTATGDDTNISINLVPKGSGAVQVGGTAVLTDIVSDTTPQLGGPLDPNGNIIRFAKGGDIASASPLVLDTDGNYFDVTGTTGFSQITCTAGDFFMLQFDGALTMTDGANLDLGGNDITTAAGDRALFFAVAANTAQLQSYFTEGGSPSAPGQSEAEAGTATIPRPWTAQRVKQAIDALGGGGITAGTSQASTSGTAVDFTSIPSGVEQIIITLHGVSLSGTDQVLVQIGDSGGIETTGYVSSTRSASGAVTSTAGFIVHRPAVAASLRTGHITLTRRTGNVWVSSHVTHDENDNSENSTGGGSKTLSAELDRLRITRTGTDTFDAGNINIHYL